MNKRTKIITESASHIGAETNEIFNLGTSKPLEVATARSVHVLNLLRELAESKPVTAEEIQLAIDSLLKGSRVRIVRTPHGSQIFELDTGN